MRSPAAFESGSGANVTQEQKRLEELETAKVILNERTTQLVEAQRLGKIGDWSYRLGEPDLWWAPEIYNLLGYDPATFKTTRDAVMSLYVADGANRVLESQAQVISTGVVQGDGASAPFPTRPAICGAPSKKNGTGTCKM